MTILLLSKIILFSSDTQVNIAYKDASVQCNIGCNLVDAGVQCDLGSLISASTPLQQPFIQSESEISECEGDNEFNVSGGTYCLSQDSSSQS